MIGSAESREDPIVGYTADPTNLLDLSATVLEDPVQLRSQSSSNGLSMLLPLVNRATGIIASVEKVIDKPVHVYVSMHNGGLDHQAARLQRLPGVIAASGKGFNETAAKMSCIGEAIERFSCGFLPSRIAAIAERAALDGPSLDPRSMLNFSAGQYRQRASASSVRYAADVDFNWVPPPYVESMEIGWTKGVDLSTGTDIYLPAALCYFNYHREGEPNFGHADSNGCASGATIGEALLHGLLELVERDACAIWWYNRLPKFGIALDRNLPEDINAVVQALRSEGLDVVVLDLTTDLKIPVCAAITSRADGKCINIGLGASLHLGAAARRALSEALQVGVTDVAAMPQHPTNAIQRELVAWYHNTMIDQLPFAKPADYIEIDWDEQAGEQVPPLQTVMNALRACGCPVFALNISRKDLPLKVVRAIAPNLRHFWRRLGPGRLYDVPVQMGWLERPLPEEQLNPMNYVL